MFKNKSNRILLVGTALMLSVSAVSGYAMARTTASPLREEAQETVARGCERTDVYNYTVCGKSVTQVTKISGEFVGLNKQELAEKLTDGRVTSFSANAVTVTHDVRQYCSEHYLLIYEEGELFIRQNTGYTEELETVTALGAPVKALRTSVLKRLEEGIVFSTLSAAKRYATDDIYN